MTSTYPSPVAQVETIRFDDVRAWLVDQAFPLWGTAGVDEARGGAVEALDFDGLDAGLPYKRVRAQARQVYAFTKGSLLGWSPAGARGAEHVWRFLSDHARRPDGGWVRLLARDGSVLEAAADAYDSAFILYALAWRARGGDETAMGQAHAVMDGMERLLGFGRGQGFRAAEDKPQERLQNPHMHLLEACLELAMVGQDQRFADLAADILGLFARHMFDPSRGVLLESFDADWRPAQGAEQRVEPGHLYEWIWLLHRAEAVTGLRHREEARALCAFAEGRGLSPDGRLAVDGLDGPTLAPRPTSRLWPQAEALKAHLALFEHQHVNGRARIGEIVGQLLDRFLLPRPAGGWMDRLGPGGRPAADTIPSSVFYHLVLAFSELLRLEPKLRQP